MDCGCMLSAWRHVLLRHVHAHSNARDEVTAEKVRTLARRWHARIVLTLTRAREGGAAAAEACHGTTAVERATRAGASLQATIA